MKTTKIISAFPATGKTYVTRKAETLGLTIQDSDSSDFSWNADKTTRHDEWPQNYLKHIMTSIGKVDYILVSSHQEVRNGLLDLNVKFTLVYPSVELKDEYIQRVKERGSDDLFIKLLDRNWVLFLSSLKECECAEHIQLGSGEFLEKVIKEK